MGAASAAGADRGGRCPVRMERHRQPRDLLRGGRAQHVDELARLRVRVVRSSRDDHRRQASWGILGAGAVGARVRPACLGNRRSPGSGGDGERARPVPRRPPPVRGAGGDRRRGRARSVAGDRAAQSRKHPGHADGAAAVAGGRQHRERDRLRAAAEPDRRRGPGRPRLSGQDDRSLVGAARARVGLSRERARGARSQARAARGSRGRGRGGIAQLDGARVGVAGARPPVRRRQQHELDLQPGVRLQRLRPRGPGITESAADEGDRPDARLDPGRRRPPVQRHRRAGHGVADPGRAGRARRLPARVPAANDCRRRTTAGGGTT